MHSFLPCRLHFRKSSYIIKRVESVFNVFFLSFIWIRKAAIASWARPGLLYSKDRSNAPCMNIEDCH